MERTETYLWARGHQYKNKKDAGDDQEGTDIFAFCSFMAERVEAGGIVFFRTGVGCFCWTRYEGRFNTPQNFNLNKDDPACKLSAKAKVIGKNQRIAQIFKFEYSTIMKCISLFYLSLSR